MTSPQHARWIRSGMQWQLARPLVALRDRLRAYGYTCFDIGDTRHMDHIPPEDHTPYSETGWPGTTPYGWVTAVDIMPPGGGLPSLQQLGAQLRADREAGVPGVAWLKYMNWGPTSNRTAVQDRWTPNLRRSSSSDVGHIHLSGRSDHVTSATQAELDYDPVARLRGQTTTSSGGDGTVAFYITPDGAVYNENAVHILASEFPPEVASRIALVPAASIDRVLQLTGARAALDPAALKSVLVEALDAALPDVATADVTAALEAALQAPAVHGALVSAAEEGANRAEDS